MANKKQFYNINDILKNDKPFHILVQTPRAMGRRYYLTSLLTSILNKQPDVSKTVERDKK